MDRYYIKSLAKARLRETRGRAIPAALMRSLLGYVGIAALVIMLYVYNYGKDEDQLLLLFLPIAYDLLCLLLTGPITLGMQGWFLRSWRGEEPPAKDALQGFKMFSSGVAVDFLKKLFVRLWSAIFFVIGIVMGYSYSMAEFVLYENPQISAGKALKMSKIMTKGFKGELFALDMSFLGWSLLSLLTLGIVGVVYATPYFEYVRAAYYERLKERALQYGLLRWDEFGQEPPPPPKSEEDEDM